MQHHQDAGKKVWRAEAREGTHLQLEPSVSAPVRRGGPEPGRIGIPCEIA